MNKIQQHASDQKLLAGFQKHANPAQSLTVGGKTYTFDEIVAILQSRIDAANAASAAKAAWQNGSDGERATIAQTKEFVDEFGRAMSVLYVSVDVLSDFGIPPRKPRKALSGPEQVAKADKARATRVARHTLGKKQKLS